MKIGLTAALATVALQQHTRQHRQLGGVFRGLELNQTCLDDTTALSEDPAIVAAFEDFEDELDAFDVENACSRNGSTFRCVFSRDDFDTLDNYEDTCEQVGGQSHSVDGAVVCDIREGSESVEFIYGFNNIPECIAASCDPDEVSEEFDSFFAEVASQLGPALRAVGFDSASCRATEDVPSSAKHVSLLLLGSIGAFATSWFLV